MASYRTIVSISYTDLFDDYETVEIRDLLRDIPSRSALEVICHFLGQLHTQERSHEHQLLFIQIWAGRLPSELLDKINEFISKRRNERNAEFNFINNVSALRLIERILEDYNSLEPVVNLTPEQELRLFKAYLLCTQEWLDQQNKAWTGEEIQTAKDLVKVIFPVQAPQVELIEFKDFRLQFIKAIYFFRFCLKDPLFSGYLQIFLDSMKFDSWQDYLAHLLDAYTRKLTPPSIPTLLQVDEEFKDFREEIQKFCLDTANYKRSDDFTGLRGNPILKYDEDKFLFLNLNFFIDKIYQGIQFDFALALKKAKATYKGKVIKDFPGFKQIYGEIYSEHGLFYQVLEYVFRTQRKYLKISGEELHKTLGQGEPDYYIRDKSKVYLFEYKDVLFAAGPKHSYDYEAVKGEIFKKLVENQGGSAKGVTQLVNSIEKISLGEYQKVDDFDFSKAIIYPIIVYTDPTFNMPGVNYVLQQEFNQLIKERGLGEKLNVKPLVLIDLDSFIKFQDLFGEKRLTINHLLNGFLEHISSKDIFRQISTFNQFIHNKTLKMSYGTPKMFMEEAFKVLEGYRNSDDA